MSGSNRKRFDVELENGTLLAGDYLPSRRATSQVLAVERAERARLDVHADGATKTVDNNLGVAVRELILRDLDGNFLAWGGEIEPGARAELIASKADPALGRRIELMLRSTLPLSGFGATDPLEVLPPGSYLAWLANGPFRDDCGIETTELGGSHVVLGILPIESEEGR